MADKKTTQETLRTPIDGTELVRLATTGANWQAPLSSIFSTLGGGGGGSAAAPQFAIQFNNPLGTLDGDTLALLNPSLGLVIGGATESGGVVTPGAGLHSAFGKHGVPDWIDLFDGLGPQLRDITLVVNDRFSSDPGIGETAGIASSIVMDAGLHGIGGWFCATTSDNGVANRGVSGLQMLAVNYEMTATSIDELIAMSGEAINMGNEVANVIGLHFNAFNQGGHQVQTLKGLAIALKANGSSPSAETKGIEIYHNNISGTDTYYAFQTMGSINAQNAGYGIYLTNISAANFTRGIFVDQMWGGDAVGIEIADCSAAATGNPGISYNFWSRGNSSLNVFDGILRFGTATNSSPQNGDVWFDGTNLKLRTGGATKTFTVT